MEPKHDIFKCHPAYHLLPVLMLLVLFCIPLRSGAVERAADWAQFDRYRADNRRVAALPREKRKAVLFGNSITDSWASMRPEFFNSNALVGRGISGQSTYQFLARFRTDAVDLSPQVIVLNGATNDIAENTHPYDEHKTFGNIRSMVEIARANGIGVILTSVLPAAGFKWNRSVTDAPEKIVALNGRLRALAEELGIPYVDYHALMLAPDGRALNPALALDGVHPNEKGYEVMEEALMKVLAPMLDKETEK